MGLFVLAFILVWLLDKLCVTNVLPSQVFEFGLPIVVLTQVGIGIWSDHKTKQKKKFRSDNSNG